MAGNARVRVRVASLVVLTGAFAGLYWVPNPAAAVPSTDAASPPALNADVAPLGANFFLEREVEDWKRELTVTMAREAGIRWIKQMFNWEEIEPRKGEFFDLKFRKSTWEKYDAIVDLAEQHGMRVIARLDRPPAWARDDNTYPGAPPDRFQDYFDFVRAVAERYRGRIQHYQIWTEPNIWPEWGKRGVDPAGYVRLLRGAYLAIKSVDPDAVVLSAPLAQTLEESRRNMSELNYLEAMYRAGAAPYFDILAANVYGFDAPPDAPADPKALNFARVLLVREVMERNGDADKPVWFNEFGWNASPADIPADKLTWRRVSEDQQARYTAEAVRIAREWGWVGVLNYWYFRHAGDISVDRSDYFFRMVDVDFTPRPVFHLWKAIGEEVAVAGPGSHEETHGAVDARGTWRSERAAWASQGRVWIAPPRGTLTISMEGTGASLRAAAGPRPIALRVTIDGAEPADPLTVGTEPGGAVTIPLARDLAAGRHTLLIEDVSDNGGGGWALDGFEVEHAPNALPFWGLTALAIAGVAGLLATALRWRRA